MLDVGIKQVNVAIYGVMQGLNMQKQHRPMVQDNIQQRGTFFRLYSEKERLRVSGM